VSSCQKLGSGNERSALIKLALLNPGGVARSLRNVLIKRSHRRAAPARALFPRSPVRAGRAVRVDSPPIATLAEALTRIVRKACERRCDTEPETGRRRDTNGEEEHHAIGPHTFDPGHTKLVGHRPQRAPMRSNVRPTGRALRRLRRSWRSR